VLDDADITAAVSAGLSACFLNSGQTCIALSRMIVPRSKLAEVEAAAKAGLSGVGAHAIERERRRGRVATRGMSSLPGEGTPNPAPPPASTEPPPPKSAARSLLPPVAKAKLLVPKALAMSTLDTSNRQRTIAGYEEAGCRRFAT
jgi:hypothetical protein